MIRVLNYVALVGVIVAVACTAIVSPAEAAPRHHHRAHHRHHHRVVHHQPSHH